MLLRALDRSLQLDDNHTRLQPVQRPSHAGKNKRLGAFDVDLDDVEACESDLSGPGIEDVDGNLLSVAVTVLGQHASVSGVVPSAPPQLDRSGHGAERTSDHRDVQAVLLRGAFESRRRRRGRLERVDLAVTLLTQAARSGEGMDAHVRADVDHHVSRAHVIA